MSAQTQRSAFSHVWQLVNLFMFALGIAGVYFMTIQSLKVELAAKAEAAVVETLDKKLGAFEVFLKEGVFTKEEFYRFSKEVDSRLSRIEFRLADKLGDKGGKN